MAKLPAPEVEQETDEVFFPPRGNPQGFVRSSEDVNAEKSHGIRILKTGRAFRPATASDLSFMTAVPLLHLSPSKQGRKTGVFCFGHESYGMSLGMGSGKLMAQVMRGAQIR